MENRVELFKKTYDTLFTAWASGNLRHGDCDACAVGNICGGFTQWSYRFHTSRGVQYWDKHLGGEADVSPADLQYAKAIISRTGYSDKELAAIEFAFETASPGLCNVKNTPDIQYLGLCAVMDVLWDIHNIQDQSLKALNDAAISKGVKVND